MRRNDRERDATNAAEDALRAAIAADKARAVEGMRPALSRDVAESLIDEFARRFAARSRSRNRGTPVWEREVAARAALLAALTGARQAEAPAEMRGGAICPMCHTARPFTAPLDGAASVCADCALAGAGGGR